MTTLATPIKDVVRSRYSQAAASVRDQQAPASCCGPTELPDFSALGDSILLQPAAASCCSPADSSKLVAASLLYSQDELTSLPDTAALASLGCGNPTAIAALQPGQVVLDLGSGGGIDCFLAARQVGPAGQVIGLDMTPAMIELAERNQAKLGDAVAHVRFIHGEIEAIPLPDASVDVIISNCVINLSPDKDAVFREAFRVLRPGGALAVSDVVAWQPLPAELARDAAAWSACVAGALDVESYTARLSAAGFGEIAIDSVTPTDFGLSQGVADGASAVASGLRGRELSDWIASAEIKARKPSA